MSRDTLGSRQAAGSFPDTGQRTTPAAPGATSGAPSSQRRRRARVPAQAWWPLTIALILLSASSNAALGSLLRGSGWWWAMTLIAAIVLGASGAFRRSGLSRVLTPVASAGVLLLLMTLLFGGGTGLLWLIPTPGTLAQFAELAATGTNSIVQQSTPAEPITGIVFLLVGGAGLLAIVMDILAISVRKPALAAIPALVPVLIPGFIIEDGAGLVPLVATASAYLVLLRADARLRRTADLPLAWSGAAQSQGARPRVRVSRQSRPSGPLWSSVSVGAISVTAALILSISTPLLSTGDPTTSRGSGLLFGAGVSPMIDLGQDLRRPKSSKALHYRTTADTPPYLKLLTLDTLDGAAWISSDANETGSNLDAIAAPEGLSADVARSESVTSVVIDNVRSKWLPAPAMATSVDGLGESWTWLSGNRTIVGDKPTTRGDSYEVTALELHPTEAQLRTAGTDYPTGILFNLSLPEDVPDIVTTTAAEVTADASSPYDAAIAIQDYLRGGTFTYDTESPVEAGYDGGSLEVISAFLDVKRGYCVHFAATMAVMARDLGIPARIAVGYLPGGRVTDVTQGYGQYIVDSHDLHAWPELYFSGVGWLPFEPTPGRGSVPDYAQPDDSSVVAPTQAPVQPTDAAVPTDSAARPDSGGLAASEGGATDSGYAARGVLALGGVVCLLLLPALVRWIRRRMRVAQIRGGRAGQSAAWAELTDTVRDHGMAVSETSTLREQASALCGLLGATLPRDGRADEAQEAPEVRAAVDRLLVAEERLRYSQSQELLSRGSAADGARIADDLILLLRRIEAGSRPVERMRAILVPASLWPTMLSWQNKARTGA